MTGPGELRIGIDAGARRTTAVLLGGGHPGGPERFPDDIVLARCARPTSADPAATVDAVLAELIAPPMRPLVGRVVVSTSAPADAARTAAGLARVGVLRIGAPAAVAIPPLTGWPADLAAAVRGPVAMVGGGHSYDGAEFAALDVEAVLAFGIACREAGVEAVAVAAIDAHVVPVHEERARGLLSDVLGPGVPVVVSHEAGGSGLLERENAAVLDAALAPAAQRVVEGIGRVLARAGIDADLYLMGGDGTVLPADRAVRHPLHTLGASHGAARSGAAHLTGIATMVVVQADGPRALVSAQAGGLPLESGLLTEVHGIRTAMRAIRVVECGPGVGAVRAAVGRAGAGLGAVPVVVVGDGRPDVADGGDGGATVVRPAEAGFAAAFGAATGEASATVDRLFWFGDSSRAACGEVARRSAADAAIRAGADPARLRVGVVQEALMTYVPVSCVRLRVTATGPLATQQSTAVGSEPEWPAREVAG